VRVPSRRATAPGVPAAAPERWLYGPSPLPGRGSGLPEDTLWREVSVDPTHLAHYAHVCGFTLRDELPPTYPHVLAFGLQMELLARAPFSAVGVVHIANRIVQHRPILLGETLALSASVRGFEPHRNSRPVLGMASSLRLGLNALAAERWQPLDGALIVMGDQPLLRVEVIESLVLAFEPPVDVVRPCYSAEPEAPGHPVIVHRRLWARARSLTGDHGFRAIETWSEVRLETIAVEGTNPDIDTPEDLARLEEQAGPE